MRSRSLLWSFNYAIEGIVYALRTQRNMRLHTTAALLVLGASLFFKISRLEFIAILFAIVFAWVLVGQAMSPGQVLGGVAILAGVVAVKLGEGASAAPEALPADDVDPAVLAGFGATDPVH